MFLGHQSAVAPQRQPPSSRRLEVSHSVLYPSQRMFSMLYDPMDIFIEFNTGFTSSNTLVTDAPDRNAANPGLTLEGNLLERSLYGMSGGGREGAAFLEKYFSPLDVGVNGLINNSRGTEQELSDELLQARYGSNVRVLGGLAKIGFIRPTFTGRDYQGFALSRNSPAAGKGSQGKNLGADISALERALPNPLF